MQKTFSIKFLVITIPFLFFCLVFFIDNFFVGRASGTISITVKIAGEGIDNEEFVEGYAALSRTATFDDVGIYDSISGIFATGLIDPGTAILFNRNSGNSICVTIPTPFAQVSKPLSNRTRTSFFDQTAVVVLRYRDGRCNVQVAPLFEDGQIQKIIAITVDDSETKDTKKDTTGKWETKKDTNKSIAIVLASTCWL